MLAVASETAGEAAAAERALYQEPVGCFVAAVEKDRSQAYVADSAGAEQSLGGSQRHEMRGKQRIGAAAAAAAAAAAKLETYMYLGLCRLIPLAAAMAPGVDKALVAAQHGHSHECWG